MQAQVVRMAVLTDPHLAHPSTADGTWNNATRYSLSRRLLDEAVAAISEAGLTDVLVLGDSAHHGDAEHLHHLLTTLDSAGLSTLIVPGNHDVARDQDLVRTTASPSQSVTPLSRR